MKLLAYHIENYGKIHNVDGTFGAGLTEFCEKNGYGKTTMASFIRAMFYGLPSYTVKTKNFDDRQHFYPFEGGKFGGNITFEMQGKTYKIERFFDKKSSKGDECKVYLDGALYMGFGEDIGKEVFGLDEESFKKTVFITAEEIEVESTHAINEKLNRDVVGEDSDYETALEALDKAKKNLKAGRGNNDLISRTKTEILDLTARIQNLQDMSDGLTVEYQQRDRLTKEIAGLEIDLKRANEYHLLLQKWETLDNLSAQTEQKRQILQGYEVKYPQGMPSEDERQTLRECAQEQARLSGALQTATFGEDKENALRALGQKFINGVPTEQEIAEKQQNLVRLATLHNEANAWKNRPQTEQEKDLQHRFAGGIPSDELLNAKRAQVDEYKRKDAQLKELHNTLVNAQPMQTQPSGVGKWVYFLLAALCVIGGIALMLVQHLVLGVVLAVVGVGLAASGFFLVVKPAQGGVSNADVTVQIAALQADLKILEEGLRAVTVHYRYYSEAGAVYDFTMLEEGVRAYRAQLSAQSEGEKRFAEVVQEMQTITAQTQAYLAQYGESGDLREGLNRLLSAVSNYQSLLQDKALASGKTEEVRARLLRTQTTMQEILKKYHFDAYVGTMDGLSGLEIDCKRLREVRCELADLEENLTDYKQKNGLVERPKMENVDADDLHARLSILRKQLADCDKRIAETERVVAQLPDTESARDQAEEKLEYYKDRHQLISETMDALQGAEKALKDRYIAPIRDRFSHYAEALERVLDEKISMDSDYRVKFERGGEDRSDRHLSAGERSLCALCVRLALIDNMYEGEQPFIVMDDPFVHLDETHLKRVAELMETLSQGRQIIYFCCHDSRSMVK